MAFPGSGCLFFYNFEGNGLDSGPNKYHMNTESGMFVSDPTTVGGSYALSCDGVHRMSAALPARFYSGMRDYTIEFDVKYNVIDAVSIQKISTFTDGLGFDGITIHSIQAPPIIPYFDFYVLHSYLVSPPSNYDTNTLIYQGLPATGQSALQSGVWTHFTYINKFSEHTAYGYVSTSGYLNFAVSGTSTGDKIVPLQDIRSVNVGEGSGFYLKNLAMYNYAKPFERLNLSYSGYLVASGCLRPDASYGLKFLKDDFEVPTNSTPRYWSNSGIIEVDLNKMSLESRAAVNQVVLTQNNWVAAKSLLSGISNTDRLNVK